MESIYNPTSSIQVQSNNETIKTQIIKDVTKSFFYNKNMRILLSETGRKGLVYATNQELPHQTFNEEAIHSITQDYNSIKTKIIKHVSDQKHRPGETAPTPNPFLKYYLLSLNTISRLSTICQISLNGKI